MVPALRVRTVEDRPERADGEYVLYWMIAARRTRDNFGIQHAAERARALGKPLLVYEALRADYRWKSERFDRFVYGGMRDNAAHCAERGVTYFPFIESKPGSRMLEKLAKKACLVVTDDFPCFFLPHMVAKAGRVLDVRLEAVDGNGILPLASSASEFKTAHSFRRFVHKEIRPHLTAFPERDPLHGVDGAPMPPGASEIPEGTGGARRGEAIWEEFFAGSFGDYAAPKKNAAERGSSGLSPYLHFGHIGSHRMVGDILASWDPAQVTPPDNGRREGWWGLGASAEAFLDQIVTWRELGFHFNGHRPDYDRYESLPDWARTTLAQHAGDAREPCYTLEELDDGATHDELWNAAQGELRREGRIHNYLRMLWGKKILEWSASPEEALDNLIELNNRYALDGRDPNSYSGIFWTLGRFDRAWGPERPIFGKIRYMSSENTARKMRVREYVETYA
ncbi:MAG: deoxyribodipyrimidine photolyase [Planctomycetota bacterium]